MSERVLLKPLVDDLEFRVRPRGQAAEYASLELGKFLEDLRKAVGSAVGLEVSDFDHLASTLRKAGVELPHFVGVDLKGIYFRRNHAAHPNPEPLDFKQILADFDELVAHLHRLAELLGPRLTGTTFAEVLYAAQESSRTQLRARSLNTLIATVLPGERALVPVLDFARERLPGRLRDFDVVSPEHRSRAIVRELANHVVSRDVDLLVELALHLASLVGAEGDALLAWARNEAQRRLQLPVTRLPTLAVWLVPRPEGGYLLRWAGLLHPVIPGLDALLAEKLKLPRPIAAAAQVFETLMLVAKTVGTVAATLPGGAVPLDWRETALQINVAPEDAGTRFEGLTNRMGTPLAGYFLGVAVRPLFADNGGATAPANRIQSPNLRPSNSVKFERAVSPAALFDEARRHVAAFYPAWGAPPDEGAELPAVTAFDGHACALVARTMPLEDALRAIFPEDAEVSIRDLFARVTELRSTQQVLVLWDDPEYRPTLPEVV